MTDVKADAKPKLLYVEDDDEDEAEDEAEEE